MFKKVLITLILFLIIPLVSWGNLLDELDQQIQRQEDKRAQLEKQAQEYQEVINQKQKEIRSLNNTIDIFNARINKLQVEINITEDDVQNTELEILQLEYGIDQALDDIAKQKESLAKIIQAFAEQDQVSQMEIILQSENFSDFFNQITYLENLQQGIQEKVESLIDLKDNLHQDKESKEEKKEKLEGLQKQLISQKWSLASQRETKNNLLDHTRGEEGKYQQMLANIEAQKQDLLGDLNKLRQQKASELARLKELQEKPPQQYWASLNWYFSQDDPRWSKTAIGISNSELGDYGCAITSVAMILNYHEVSSINPGQLAKEKIYAWDLIYWPKRWGNISCVNCPPSHSTFDWSRLDREIGAGYPVIVFIQADGYGRAGHYVVVHHRTENGDYVVHDPLFGANIYLSSTQAYLSKLYETTTSLDQMVIYH